MPITTARDRREEGGPTEQHRRRRANQFLLQATSSNQQHPTVSHSSQAQTVYVRTYIQDKLPRMRSCPAYRTAMQIGLQGPDSAPGQFSSIARVRTTRIGQAGSVGKPVVSMWRVEQVFWPGPSGTWPAQPGVASSREPAPSPAPAPTDFPRLVLSATHPRTNAPWRWGAYSDPDPRRQRACNNKARTSRKSPTMEERFPIGTVRLGMGRPGGSPSMHGCWSGGGGVRPMAHDPAQPTQATYIVPSPLGRDAKR